MENSGVVKFELVSPEFRKHDSGNDYQIPTRATSESAGYDFTLAEDVAINVGESVLSFTDMRVKIEPGHFLQLSIRSSLGRKGLIIPNAPGIVDSDYYNNKKTGGNIGIILANFTREPFLLKKGEKVMQGIVLKYHTAGDMINKTREGGFGSTSNMKQEENK